MGLSALVKSLSCRMVTQKIKKLIPYLYSRHFRRYLPRKSSKLNGVTVGYKRLFDDWVPWAQTHPDPEKYECAIISSLKQHVELGDTVTIVGGGWGVTTVVAAEQTGDEGCIRTFEASTQYAEYVKESAEMNDVNDRVTVQNAIVSHTVSTLGSSDSDVTLDPSRLPDCDVLELDCEGAEIEILKKLKIRPQVLIVETHGINGAPTENVIESLESLSYRIISNELAEGGSQADYCEKNDIRVLTALRE